jgi:hypothetical protein
MPLKVWNGSSWVTALAVKVWNGSSWVAASAGKVWNGSSWVQFFSSLFAAASPTFVSGSEQRFGAGSKYVPATPTVYVTVSGGVAPYTYLWEYVSGTAAGFNQVPGSSFMDFFRNMSVAVGEVNQEQGYYRCKVTDNAGTIVYTSTILVETTLSETS